MGRCFDGGCRLDGGAVHLPLIWHPPTAEKRDTEWQFGVLESRLPIIPVMVIVTLGSVR